MKRKFVCLIIVVLMTCLLIPLPANALCMLNVPQITQLNSNWCWAACALMTGKFLYPNTMQSQASTVAYIKGSSSNNDPGSIFETADAVFYVTNGTYYYVTTLLIPLNFNQIKTSINNSYPVIALVRNSGSGHYYVIRGYDTYPSNMVHLIDPWTGNPVSVNWNNFVNGTWSETRPYKYTVYYSGYNN